VKNEFVPNVLEYKNAIYAPGDSRRNELFLFEETPILKIFILLAALSTLVVSCTEPPETFEIVFNNPVDKNYVVGINNLRIGKVKYNVHFEFGTFSGVFGNPMRAEFPPNTLPFWGDQDKTMIAVTKIVDALNTIAPSSSCVLNKFQPYCVFFIPLATHPELTAIAWAGGRANQTNYRQHQLLALQGTSGISRSYALISESRNQ
jgi:hypothetical protein